MNDGKWTKAIIGTVFTGLALLAAAACESAPTRSRAAKAVPAGGAVVGLVSPSGPSGDSSGDPGREPGGMTNLEKVGAAAMDAVKGSTVLSFQAENNGQIWEVQLAGPDGTERLLEVDASGKGVSGPRVKDTGEKEKARVMGMVRDSELTFEEAAEKVSSSVPHGRITHMSLDRHHNDLLVWDADVVTPDGTWHEVKVGAKDGTVTRHGQKN